MIEKTHKSEEQETIIVKGARTHNLKNITVTMPRNKMIVFTGLSGSGKSSLAFDTIFAEGQRRYIESLSSYARQFLRQMQKPDVEEISGLSPAISIDQSSRSNNPRSTVATITEIYDYMRILFARVGKPHCLTCGREIKKLSNEEIMDTILKSVQTAGAKSVNKKVMGVSYSDLKLRIFSPLIVGRKGEYYQMLYDLLGKGYSKVLVDGKLQKLRERIVLDKNKKHTIDVLVYEFFVNELVHDPGATRERLSDAVEKALQESEGLLKIEDHEGNTRLISAKFMCPYDGFSFPEIEPRLFSFNSPYGACPACNGLGTKHFFGTEPCETCGGKRLREEALHVTIGDRDAIESTKKRKSKEGAECPRGKNIVEITDMSIEEASNFFAKLVLIPMERQISAVVIKEIENRLRVMLDVGIAYLTLGRRANTLSGGEAQRIRLASQLGSRLVGALYVLDEPTIGLHQKDNDKLIKTLRNLCDIGNTIIVVEHDEDTIFASDYIVDIGPGAGVHGGHIVVSGYLEELLLDKKVKSLTLDYLRKDKQIPLPEKRRVKDKGEIQLRGGKAFNINNMNVDIPLGRLVVITGVSGSGKSTFLYELVYKNLQARFDRRYRSAQIYNASLFSGTEYLHRAILIDQSPIGRTPRSNPATYTGAWTFIRDLFAETEEARVRGWRAS